MPKLTQPKTYRVNEIFYSLQGEGARAGSPNVFVRFSGCNLQCRRATEGFDCDTEFTSGRQMTAEELLAEVQQAAEGVGVPIIWTGGEPGLQLDDELTQLARARGYTNCVETNGTRELPRAVNWISCSPKTAEHTLVLKKVHELRYVRRRGMGAPKPSIESEFMYISPAAQPDGSILTEDLDWCMAMVLSHPGWRLSVQQHKFWGVR